MAQVLDRAIGAFRVEFGGTLILPQDPDYDRARSVWNGAIDRRPAVIARCSTARQVAEAVRLGREHGLEIAVRGGGHSFAGFGVCEAGLMIDLSDMRQVSVDPAARRAVAEGGATWGELDAATQAHALGVTGGFISHTGIAGLTLGGGIGWLGAGAGLTCDNLLSAQMVSADGQLMRVSAEDNPELYWAIRGGGGNFGVVTSFEYRLHAVGPLVQLGMFFWTVERGTEGLRFSRDLISQLPNGTAGFIAGLSAPPAPFVPEPLRGSPGYALLVVGFGSPDEHAKIVKTIRAGVPPAFDLVTPIPYTQLQQMFDNDAPWGAHAYEKALYLEDLTDDVIRVFTEYLPKKQSPITLVPVFALTGAYHDIPDEESAFGGSRRARYAFNISAVCADPTLLDAERSWVRSFWRALRPYASGVGSYVNFMSEYEEDRVRAAYGAVKYDRLARIKSRYDPDNVFHLNANIQPAP